MGLLDKIKGKFLKKTIDKVIAPFDTKEERDIMAETQIKRGMPQWAASGLSFITGVVVAALQGVDISLMFSDPKTFGKVLVASIVSRLAMELQKPGTVVVEHKEASGVVTKTETIPTPVSQEVKPKE